jgi:hypothetical protein
MAPSFFPEPERPAPTYPEYEQLVADAQAAVNADGRHVDPAKLHRVQDLRRSWDWRVSVVGHDRPTRTLVEMHMLLLADQRNLNPPLPQWLVDARAAAADRDAELRAARERREAADQAEWEKTLAECSVEVEVFRNGHARVRYGYVHHLGHVVPKEDALSGRSRLHRAGRGLCETEKRSKPLDLSGGKGGPGTCVNCLTYTPKIRPVAAPPEGK